jgi:heat shock protein HslJ
MATSVPLEDTYWKLTEFDGKPFESGSAASEAHVIFRGNGKFAGYAICNSMFSSYTHDDKVLTVEPIGMTMRGCIDPAENEREQRLVGALRRARGWQVEGDRLALLDETGVVVARFQAVAQ